MRKYDSYKDSGIEWIGEIPSHWEVRRLKYVSSINDDTLSDRTDGGFEIEYVDISSIESGVGITKSEKFSFKEAPSRARRLVKDGDIIVSTVRTYLRAIARIEYPKPNLVVSTGFAVVRPRDVIPEYAGHLFYHENLLGEIVSRSVGVSYPAINSSEIGTIKIPLPNPKEQTAIASYLDRKTAEIDELIADKKRLLELYEEEKTAIIKELVTGKKVWNGNAWTEPVKIKDSGIEWLGEIPKHWEVKRLKYVLESVIGGGTPSTSNPLFWDGDIPWVSAKDMKVDQLFSSKDYITKIAVKESSTNFIEDERIIIVVRSGILKHTFPVAINKVPISINQDLKALKPKKHISIEFLFWKLKGQSKDVLIFCNKMGATVDSIEMQYLMDFPLTFPPLEEQCTILRYIETEFALIDAKKAKTKKLVELLTEYRTALISEVVTGKIKVVE